MNYIKRTTLMVRDMERSLTFFRDVLGADIWFDRPFELSGEGLPIGNAGDMIRLVIVKFKDPEIGMIGLMEFEDPPVKVPPVSYDLGYGRPVFVIVSDDAQGVYNRATKHGFKLRGDPREWSTKGARGEMKHFLSTNLWDADGHFFECNQVTRIDEPDA